MRKMADGIGMMSVAKCQRRPHRTAAGISCCYYVGEGGFIGWKQRKIATIYSIITHEL
jgi:hypothetical protein